MALCQFECHLVSLIDPLIITYGCSIRSINNIGSCRRSANRWASLKAATNAWSDVMARVLDWLLDRTCEMICSSHFRRNLQKRQAGYTSCPDSSQPRIGIVGKVFLIPSLGFLLIGRHVILRRRKLWAEALAYLILFFFFRLRCRYARRRLQGYRFYPAPSYSPPNQMKPGIWFIFFSSSSD